VRGRSGLRGDGSLGAGFTAALVVAMPAPFGLKEIAVAMAAVPAKKVHVVACAAEVVDAEPGGPPAERPD